MKKKKIIALGLVVISVCTVGFIVNSNKVKATQPVDETAFCEQWGETLKEYSDDIKTEQYASPKSNDNTIIIPKFEVEQATEFYKLQDITEEEAKVKAEEYVKKRNALYHEAILNGFDVTDTEINEFLENQKQFLAETENSAQANAMINGFGDEAAYWDYESYVYKKNLPIMKYRDFLQEQYYQENNISEDEKVEGDTLILGGNFDDYYETYQQSLLNKYTFEIQ